MDLKLDSDTIPNPDLDLGPVLRSGFVILYTIIYEMLVAGKAGCPLPSQHSPGLGLKVLLIGN